MAFYVPFRNAQRCIPIPLRASTFYKLNEAGLVFLSLFFTLGLKPNDAAPFIFYLCLHLPYSPRSSQFFDRPWSGRATLHFKNPQLIFIIMKTTRFFLAALLAAALSTSAFAQSKVLQAWDFSKIEKTKEGIVVPSPASKFNGLVFDSGAAIGTDAEIPGGKVLVLDGTQISFGAPLRSFQAVDALVIKMRFKPAAKGAESQTLLRLSGYELRYDQSRNMLNFIVWHADQTFTIVAVPVRAAIWSDVTATYEAGKITLAIVGVVKTKDLPTAEVVRTRDLPAGEVVESKSGGIRVGFMGGRPFTGSISALSLETP